LAFLVASLHALTTFLYYSQVACPSSHIPWTNTVTESEEQLEAPMLS